jgi:mono/diheme cytochrome c family protein
MFHPFSRLALVAMLLAIGTTHAAGEDIARGRYLVKAGGCNDCHTPGYPEAAGNLPESGWLTGSSLGFLGPWGVSYPANLRLYASAMTQDQWLARVRQPMRPPMPWFALRDMTDDDLAAIYAFVRSLGAAGESAPSALGPGEPVTTGFIDFEPRNLPGQGQVSR